MNYMEGKYGGDQDENEAPNAGKGRKRPGNLGKGSPAKNNKKRKLN